ncbi:MAG: M48 family metallopeptidase [Lachnospiraceae bacterium]|nr:M48 family metallopeptidase [Lachnospiraceae bacterium]
MIREYRLVRSRRRTISVEITEDESVLVRAPKWVPKYEIEAFVGRNSDWIEKHIEKVRKKKSEAEARRIYISEEELRRLGDEALSVIPDRVRYYAAVLGVTYNRITIRSQKTLWGSCSAKGNLSFNCLLMKAPEHVRDYVIVHELCHRMEMNHSAAFWENVSRVIPDHRLCRKWLREEGALLISAMKNVT